MEKNNRIGIVGVGRMGGNMARRLIDKGYNIAAVHDHNAEAAESLAQELSCEAVASPARVVETCDVILTVLTDDASMREVFAESNATSLLVNAKGRLFINFATVSPQVNIEIEALVDKHGGTSLEALMASSITQAREGTLYLMCGGKKNRFRTGAIHAGKHEFHTAPYRTHRGSVQIESPRQHGDEQQYRGTGGRIGDSAMHSDWT